MKTFSDYLLERAQIYTAKWGTEIVGTVSEVIIILKRYPANSDTLATVEVPPEQNRFLTNQKSFGGVEVNYAQWGSEISGPNHSVIGILSEFPANAKCIADVEISPKDNPFGRNLTGYQGFLSPLNNSTSATRGNKAPVLHGLLITNTLQGVDKTTLDLTSKNMLLLDEELEEDELLLELDEE